MKDVIKSSFGKTGFIVLVVVTMQVACSLIVVLLLVFNTLLLKLFFPDKDTVPADQFITVFLPMLLSYAASIPISIIIAGKALKPEKLPGKHKIPFGKLSAWFLVFFSAASIVHLIINLVQTKIFGENFSDSLVELFLNSPWMMFIYAVFIAPLVEEYIFRGLFYKMLAPFGGKWYILISALLFGLIHMNVSQIPFAFILGLFFAYVMYRTGNVLIPIVLHFITNLIGSIGVLFTNSEVGQSIVFYGILLLIGIGFIIGIVFLIKGRFRRDIMFEPAAEQSANPKQVFINPGILLSISVMILLSVYIFIMQKLDMSKLFDSLQSYFPG